jgi:Protein of unknown function (DUF732)
MRHVAALATSAGGLVLLFTPVADADPALSTEDSYYTKWLSEIGVNYQNRVSLQMMVANAHTTCAMLDQNPTPQGYQAAVARLVGGPGNFTKQEASGTVQAAVHSYCDSHSNLIYS